MPIDPKEQVRVLLASSGLLLFLVLLQQLLVALAVR
jgi:hypothetical protein